MRLKCAGKGLGLYQSRKKREVSKKKCMEERKIQCNVENNSITSTEEYSCHDGMVLQLNLMPMVHQ